MSAVSGVGGSTGTNAANTQNNTPASQANSLAPNESVFLQLLVAQMKNQDPSTPSDPTQFVGELAQFSQLEQTIQISTNTKAISTELAASNNSTNSGGSTTTPSTQKN